MKRTRLLRRIARHLPARQICGPEGEPYLIRYFVARIPLLGIGIYLHRFVASDPDRGLHDHPWSWAFSYVLAGFYLERRLRASDMDSGAMTIVDGFRRAGRFNFIRGDDFHRVLLPRNSEAWTIFIHGRRIKGWGFVRLATDPDLIGEFFEEYQPYVLDRQWPEQRWWKKTNRAED